MNNLNIFGVYQEIGSFGGGGGFMTKPIYKEELPKKVDLDILQIEGWEGVVFLMRVWYPNPYYEELGILTYANLIQ